MKILHVIPTLDPRAGGPMLIASHIAAAQATAGHDVHIMTYQSSDDGKRRIVAENSGQSGFDRVKQHLLPRINWPERILGTNAWSMSKQLVPSMEALHIHGLWEPQLLHAARFARRSNIPYIVLLHGMLLPWSMQRGRIKKKLVLTVGTRKMIDRGILQFGSRDEQDAARDLGITGPGVIIPNGTSPEQFASLPPPGTMRALHPQLQNDPYILFLGRLHEQKGIDLLLAAFQLVLHRVPTARLIVAGPDYGRSTAIKIQIDALGIGDRMLMPGPLFGVDKLAALRDAACFCLPSRHEGFSLAVLESLAAGTPVVISPECHFPEVAESGAGRIAKLDPVEIAAALSEMLIDHEFRANAAIAARRLVFTHYTWAKVAQQIIEAYSLVPRAGKDVVKP